MLEKGGCIVKGRSDGIRGRMTGIGGATPRIGIAIVDSSSSKLSRNLEFRVVLDAQEVGSIFFGFEDGEKLVPLWALRVRRCIGFLKTPGKHLEKKGLVGGMEAQI